MNVPSYNNHPRLYIGLETFAAKIKSIKEWLDWLDTEITKASNESSEYPIKMLLKKRKWFERELRKVEANHSENNSRRL